MKHESSPKKEFELSQEEGSVEVITGCMFSGKTDELIRRVRPLHHAGITAQVFYPEVDDRRKKGKVNTYDGLEFPAEPVKTSIDLLKMVDENIDVVAIDEAQFFDDGYLPAVVYQLALNGKKVIIAGLDTDFRGEGFGPMPQLIIDAEDVVKLHAYCIKCSGEANRTQRLVFSEGEHVPANYNDDVVVIGDDVVDEEKDGYESRCRHHHEVPGKPELDLNS